ncbi:hypothetical protein UY3_03363 [Chelonia mydas]|uniref:Uncharacterized protein n=1 Tax=Chelonia mydas TaxID=8469 RepID=M7CEZ9_CHEMY|nr:hypothetical protein UY3_03363 [Chelonia mydas]
MDPAGIDLSCLDTINRSPSALLVKTPHVRLTKVSGENLRLVTASVHGPLHIEGEADQVLNPYTDQI